MFDIGMSEMFLIGLVALIVVGPKDLPGLFRTVGNFMGKARGMAREFQRSMEQAANEAGVSEMSESLRAIDRRLDTASGSARKFAQSMASPKPAAVPDPAAPAPAPPAADALVPDPSAPAVGAAVQSAPKTGEGAAGPGSAA
jgi:sec-independent protein translocase protein TatB